METKDKIEFEISGNDFKNLKKFRKQHEDCLCCFDGGQFTYSFVPTGLGLLATVECACGQTLSLGDYMDYDSDEYDENKNRVLTPEDKVNEKFEAAAIIIMQLKNPRIYRLEYHSEQNFDAIYTVAKAGALWADERIGRCILDIWTLSKQGKVTKNYDGLDESAKIEKFYKYFEEHIRKEIAKYDCVNITILRYLGLSD